MEYDNGMKKSIILQYECGAPRKGDALIYDGAKWVATPHAFAFEAEQAKINALEGDIKALTDKVASLEKHVATLAKAIKENL